jgi:hypothetical protein
LAHEGLDPRTHFSLSVRQARFMHSPFDRRQLSFRLSGD